MCEFLAALFKSENTTNWIQALSAIVILVLTFKMKNIAKDALKTWIHQKNHDVFTECAGMYSTYLALINTSINNMSQLGKDIIFLHHKGDIEPQDFYSYSKELNKIKHDTSNKLKDLGFFKNIGILKELNFKNSREVDLKDIYINIHHNLEKVYRETISYNVFSQRDLIDHQRIIDKIILSLKAWEDIEAELRQKADNYNSSLT